MQKYRTAGLTFTWLGVLAVLSGMGWVVTEHLDPARSCHELFDPSMVSQITSLEGYHLKAVKLPLNGFSCAYPLDDGSTYITTTSWTPTLMVFAGLLALSVGVAIQVFTRFMFSKHKA